jgi:hypothetical protein
MKRENRIKRINDQIEELNNTRAELVCAAILDFLSTDLLLDRVGDVEEEAAEIAEKLCYRGHKV